MDLSRDALERRFIDHCEEIIEHVRTLRDYATTPDSGWLAQGELNRLNQLIGEAEQLLRALRQAG